MLELDSDNDKPPNGLLISCTLPFSTKQVHYTGQLNPLLVINACLEVAYAASSVKYTNMMWCKGGQQADMIWYCCCLDLSLIHNFVWLF